jgi:hypothetical protein
LVTTPTLGSIGIAPEVTIRLSFFAAAQSAFKVAFRRREAQVMKTTAVKLLYADEINDNAEEIPIAAQDVTMSVGRGWAGVLILRAMSRVFGLLHAQAILTNGHNHGIESSNGFQSDRSVQRADGPS